MIQFSSRRSVGAELPNKKAVVHRRNHLSKKADKAYLRRNDVAQLNDWGPSDLTIWQTKNKFCLGFPILPCLNAGNSKKAIAFAIIT